MHTANIIVLITTMISLQYRIPGLFVPGSEKSTERTFAPVELSFHGTFAPWNFCSCGTLSFLGSESSKNFRSVEHSLPWNFRSSGANVSRTFVPMKLSYHENEYSQLFVFVSDIFGNDWLQFRVVKIVRFF